MSIREMALVLDYAPDSWSVSTRYVALAIADRVSDEHGTCWASIEDVARRTGLSHRRVQEHIAILVDEGVLMRSPRFRDNGSQQSNLWTWLWTIPWQGATYRTPPLRHTAPPSRGKHATDRTPLTQYLTHR